MKKIWFTLLKMLLFFLVLFATMKIIFIVRYWSLITIEEIPFAEILKGFWATLPLDISTASFLLAIPAIIMFVSHAIDKDTLFASLRWIFYLFIAVYNLIAFGDIGVYGEWGTKLSYRALMYLEDPAEVINAADTEQTLLLIVLWTLFTILFCWLYTKFVEPSPEDYVRENKIKILPFTGSFVLVVVLLFLGMRGGFNRLPINSNRVYYSKHKIANEVSVNPAYHLVENIIDSKKLESRMQLELEYMNNDTITEHTMIIYEMPYDTITSVDTTGQQDYD